MPAFIFYFVLQFVDIWHVQRLRCLRRASILIHTHSHALHNAIHDGAPRLTAALNDPSAEDVGADECAKECDALLGGMARKAVLRLDGLDLRGYEDEVGG